MADNKLFKPGFTSTRKPTDTAQENGKIVNTPRLNQLGGLDKLHEPFGHFKNKMNIKKPK